MRPVEGAFAGPSHVSFLRLHPALAFFLLSVVMLFSVLSLVSRMLRHYNSVRGRQRIGSGTWTVLMVLIIVAAIYAEAWLGPVLCVSGVAIFASIVTHMAGELRQSYEVQDTELHEVQIIAQKPRQPEERSKLQMRLEETRRQKEMLEERNEQLQAEKERLLYDLQRFNHQIDDERSAICRGLLAKSTSQPCHFSSGMDLTSEAGGSAPSDSLPPSLPPGAPSSCGSSSSEPLGTYSQERAAQAAVAPPCPRAWDNLDTKELVPARSLLSSTGFEGVYACEDGFGAELQNGAKRLRQDGFRCPLEAALERARWLKSCEESNAPAAAAEKGSSQEPLPAQSREESKEYAPAAAREKSSGQEQLAAEALIEMVAPAVAPAATQLFTYAKQASAHTSTHKQGLAHIPREEEQPRPRDPYPVRAENLGAWTTLRNNTNIARALGVANPFRGVEQPGRAAMAQVIPAKLILNQERGQRAAGATQVIHQQAAAPAGSSTASALEARFAAHVMCNYTPRPPNKLSKKRWVSCDDLHRQLKPLTSLEAERWQPVYVKQLVTELFKDHPLFAGRPFSEWSKKLMNRDALAHSTGKTHVTYFCLEHTPTASRRCG